MQRSKNSSGTGVAFLPDFCAGPAIVEVLVIAELVAMILTMARGLAPEVDVLPEFIGISLFMLWLSLTSAAVLCVLRRHLNNVTLTQAYLVCYLALLTATGAISFGALWLNNIFNLDEIRGGLAFVGRNLSIGAIVSAVALRYFHVQFQWKQQVERQARSRIEALQARIRPHFLFNSMNTIAALIGVAPDDAEQAVEDLSELFRASLGDADKTVSFAEELELARIYERLERKRMGERLVVEWRVDDIPGDASIPRLTLQPLIENAIHHGIEKLAEGGCITVNGEVHDDRYVIRIVNPIPAADVVNAGGFRIALENTRERLALALGNAARLETERHEDRFEASIILPRVNPRRPKNGETS